MKFYLQLFLLLVPVMVSAQWSQKQLDEAKYSLKSVKLGTKLVYAGGTTDGRWGSDFYDVYNFETGEFTSAEWPGGGYNYRAGSTDDWSIYFGGTGTSTTAAAIYFGEDDRWETDNLLDSRIGMNFATFGDEVFFFDPDRWGAERIDILNVRDETWREDSLSFDRGNRTQLQVDNRLFLIGGVEEDDRGFDVRITNVDIYNLETGQWQSTNLSEERNNIAVTQVGDKIYAAGGFKDSNLSASGATKAMDIIDVNDLTVTTVEMPEANADFQAYTVGEKIVFLGGFSIKGTVYDTETGVWSEKSLTSESDLARIRGAVLGNKFYATGARFDLNKVFIYDAENDSWGEHILDVPRENADINVVGNQVLIAGGSTETRDPVSVVDIFTDINVVVNVPLALTIDFTEIDCNGESTGTITATASGGGGSFEYYLNNDFDQRNTTGVFTDLPAGTYEVNVVDADMHVTTQVVVILEPAPISFNTDVTQPTSMQNDGIICITDITGGVSPFFILFQTPVTGNCIEDLPPGDYNITVTDANGCEVSSIITLMGPSGTSDLVFDPNLRIFPNPAKDGFFIESFQELSNIFILDMNGKKLYTQEINARKSYVLRNNLAAGSYFVLIENLEGKTQVMNVIFE